MPQYKCFAKSQIVAFLFVFAHQYTKKITLIEMRYYYSVKALNMFAPNFYNALLLLCFIGYSTDLSIIDND